MSSVPVDFEKVRYSALDGRPYFWDSDYPQYIQFVVNGVWTSIPVSYVKVYVSRNAFRSARIRLTLDRTTRDEKIRKIAERAEDLLSHNGSAKEKPRPNQPTAWPNMPSKPPYRGTVGEGRPMRKQRRLLPATSSAAPSTLVHTQSRQNSADVSFLEFSVCSMENPSV